MSFQETVRTLSLAQDLAGSFELSEEAAISSRTVASILPAPSTSEALDFNRLLQAAKDKRKCSFNAGKLLNDLIRYCPTGAGRLNLCVATVLAAHPGTARESQITIDDFKTLLDEVSALPKEAELFTRLKSMVNDLKRCLIAEFRCLGNRTPAVISLKSNLSAHSPGLDQGTSGRLGSLRQLVFERDKGVCKVTGKVDDVFRDAYSEEEAEGRGLAFDDLQCAHMIPHVLNELGTGLELSEARKQVWSLLNMYSPGLSVKLRMSEIDTPRNALILSPRIHSLFGKLRLWFTFHHETTDSEVYKVEYYKRTDLDTRTLPPEDLVTFQKHHTIQNPEREYFAIHRALSIACCASRAGEAIDDEDDHRRVSKKPSL